jgi:hypothetical protein
MKTTITLELTNDELALLHTALDSHEYWQLSDTEHRSDGFVTLDEDELVDPITEEELVENGEEMLASRRLRERLWKLGYDLLGWGSNG